MALSDINVENYEELITPKDLKNEIPVPDTTNIEKGRDEIKNILEGKDNRKILFIGPCSIHNVEEGLEFADKLKNLAEKVKDKFLIVMRTYFEKPRSSIGWKGLVYDPHLDGSYEMNEGLKKTRKMLLDLNKKGVLCATEFLGVWTPQYIGDLITWAAVGARTVESQPHREMVSGLSMPTGIKNNTFGSISSAIKAMKSSVNKHTFIGIDNEGKGSIVNTKGNKNINLVLRGGDRPNYDEEFVKDASDKLEKEGLNNNVIVDCSHGNSQKDFTKQPEVFREAIKQIRNGSNIKGIMLESNLEEGNQEIGDEELKKGVSVTDECLGWEDTEKLVMEGYKEIQE